MNTGILNIFFRKMKTNNNSFSDNVGKLTKSLDEKLVSIIRNIFAMLNNLHESISYDAKRINQNIVLQATTMKNYF